MIQIFLKPSAVTAGAWELAYERIRSIAEHFPTKLIRLESYTDYENKFNVEHFDLVVNEGLANEYISFRGDWMSYTGKDRVVFFKDWEKQQAYAHSFSKELDPSKPIVWMPDQPYRNYGKSLMANGIVLHNYYMIETEGAHYHAALMAIGTMLENLFPDSAFMAMEESGNAELVAAVVGWLAAHFGEDFDDPLYTDRPRLLASLRQADASDQEIVSRLAHIYAEKHKHNMEFALQNIGYQPTIEVYSEQLARGNSFGTFGFSDLLDPWMAATQSLEATLDLIATAKKLLLSDPGNETDIAEAQKYDYTYILEKLLDDYILWTPLQREKLAHFHTNQQALEGKQEDLFETMSRMMGMRVDICPFYASRDELFEAFMYHDPQNGATYEKIIDNWIEKKQHSQEKLLQKLESKMDQLAQQQQPASDTEQQRLRTEASIASFVEKYPDHERYLVRQALLLNPGFMDEEGAVAELKARVIKAKTQQIGQDYMTEIRSLPPDVHHQFIKMRIREVGYAVHPNFEAWLNDTTDIEILVHLNFAMALKLYDRSSHFARSRMLRDKRYWQQWG